MDTEEFYKSKKWKIKRKGILKRDKWKCQLCKRYGKTIDAVTVHHIKPLETHPELALLSSNLISLCKKCHNKMHPEKARKANLSRKK